MKECLSEEAKEFLVFSYFNEEYGVLEKESEKMIEVCAQRAYLDLCRTLKYSKSTSQIKEMNEEERINYENLKKNYVNEICKKIKEDIFKNFPITQNYDDFDKWHSDICQKIIKIPNDFFDLFEEESLCYGQAQKWVNMTLKYLWLLGYWKANEAEILKSVLHVPVDSYIMKAAKDIDIKVPKKKWSKWEEREYKKFQGNIREKIKEEKKTPIEWEGQAWIEIAKKRREKESKL